MTDARATVIAALVAGVFSLTGTAITAVVQLVNHTAAPGGEPASKSASDEMRGEEGVCIRLADRLLELRATKPRIARAARRGGRALPRLYTDNEAAVCGYDRDAVARMLAGRASKAGIPKQEDPP